MLFGSRSKTGLTSTNRLPSGATTHRWPHVSRSPPRLSMRACCTRFMTQEVAMDSGTHPTCGRFPPGGAAARRRVGALLTSCLLLLAATCSFVVADPAATQAPTESAQAMPSLRQDATFTHITIEQGLSD